MTPELKELLRVLCVHPDIFEATVETKEGPKFKITYRGWDSVLGDDRVCYEVVDL